MDPIKITIDRPREMRFTYSSFARLARECGINVNAPSFFREPFSPDALSSLIWAGQLHLKKPLSKREIEEILPISWDASLDMYTLLLQAIMDARGMKAEKDVKKDDSSTADDS